MDKYTTYRNEEITRMNCGKFICFCGLDACGKSTQAKYLMDYFLEYGVKSQVVHGFKNGRHSEKLKEQVGILNGVFHNSYTPEMRSLSYVCDIMEKYIDVIKPLIDNGVYVISDKYKVESLVYAPLFDCRKELIYPFINIIPNPDIYIYLSIEPQISYQRLLKRVCVTGETLSPKDDIKCMIKSKTRFDEFYNNNDNCFLIDANNDEKDIHDNILRLLYEKKILS